MDDRAGLIERAAALLHPSTSTSQGPGPLIPDALVAAAVPPLSRSVVLDRVHLAETGIIMPWTTTVRVVEEFRIVKRNLMFPWQSAEYLGTADPPSKVVMVTSSRPREGKTFCSINLALAFAADKDFVTVLIDADAVRGDTARVLQVPPGPGLADVLAGERPLHEALIQTDIPNLVILPPGAYGPHIPELLAGRAPSLLVAEIGRRYPDHVIVMDTPPCLASTDPSALAPISGQVVFVIEAGHTQQSEIESSLRLLSGCQQISFLLNKAPTGSSEDFGAYSYYYQPGTPAAKSGED